VAEMGMRVLLVAKDGVDAFAGLSEDVVHRQYRK
jgi:hypothetical protein